MTSFLTQTKKDIDKSIRDRKEAISRLETARSVLTGKTAPEDIDPQTGKRRSGRPRRTK